MSWRASSPGHPFLWVDGWHGSAFSPPPGRCVHDVRTCLCEDINPAGAAKTRLAPLRPLRPARVTCRWEQSAWNDSVSAWQCVASYEPGDLHDFMKTQEPFAS